MRIKFHFPRYFIELNLVPLEDCYRVECWSVDRGLVIDEVFEPQDFETREEAQAYFDDREEELSEGNPFDETAGKPISIE